MGEDKQYLELKENWDKILENLSQKINIPVYEGVIKPTFPVSLENNVLTINTPNDFSRDWCSTRYQEPISDAIKEATSRVYELKFITQNVEPKEENIPKNIDSRSSVVKEEKTVNTVENTNHHSNNHSATVFNNLNPNYTFENYVIGNNNHFSTAAAQKVAESPGRAYNPLFIYGGVGLGKTHLMHSIGNQMLKNRKDAKVAYISTEKFTNELINSIKDDKMIEFKNKYRNIDLLLIDDIQFIERKERTQEEFFHTFNALYDEGKQIVISSDRTPKEISSIEERLRSRFEMGLLADVQPPDYETRIAILKKKAEYENILVSDDILDYIAGAFKDNVRELEGALLRVMAYASLTNIPATVNLARTILGREPSKEITLEGIQKAVATFYGLEVDDIKSNLKTKEVTWARHVAMYISRDRTKYALQKISLAFGRKDHTTVLHAYEKVKNSLQNDSEIKADIQKMIESIEE
jgi:chromosomal replication initiator protein